MTGEVESVRLPAGRLVEAVGDLGERHGRVWVTVFRQRRQMDVRGTAVLGLVTGMLVEPPHEHTVPSEVEPVANGGKLAVEGERDAQHTTIAVLNLELPKLEPISCPPLCDSADARPTGRPRPIVDIRDCVNDCADVRREHSVSQRRFSRYSAKRSSASKNSSDSINSPSASRNAST